MRFQSPWTLKVERSKLEVLPPHSNKSKRPFPNPVYNSPMPHLTASAPILLVTDVVASANYFRNACGFDYKEFYGHPPDFVILHRDGMHLMLAKVDDPSQTAIYWKTRHNMWNAYFWCTDPDALYQEFKSKGALMDYGPCTQPYGVREFGIHSPDGHDIGFGEVIG